MYEVEIHIGSALAGQGNLILKNLLFFYIQIRLTRALVDHEVTDDILSTLCYEKGICLWHFAVVMHSGTEIHFVAEQHNAIPYSNYLCELYDSI